MGKLGEEVSQKIRSAIKAKLTELGIHMDNELPDYVMVLVANKKSQKQMDQDLQLFLGPSTTLFTSWLHNVLKKLEQVTVKDTKKKDDKKPRRSSDESGDDELKRKPSEDDFRASSLSIKKESDEDDDEYINLRDEFEGDNFTEAKEASNEIQSELKFDLSSPGRKDKRESKKERVKITWEEGAQPERRKEDEWRKKERRDKEDNRARKEEKKGRVVDAREILNKRKEKDEGKKIEPSEKAKKQLPSVSKLVIHDKSDKQSPSIPSLVKATIPPRPKATGIQANKNLILKAVADAEKSVATSRKLRQAAEQVCRPVTLKRKITQPLDFVPPSKISITLANDRVPSSSDTLTSDADDSKGAVEETEYVPQPLSTRKGNSSSKTTESAVNGEPKFLITLDGKPPGEMYDMEWDSEILCTVTDDSLLDETDEVKDQRNSFFSKVRFNKDRLGPIPTGNAELSSTLYSDQGLEDPRSEDEGKNPSPQIKYMKRCQFFPNCKSGGECCFHHPTEPCRMFPLCKFKNQCLFIHPPCKFGSSCASITCPYDHSGSPMASKKSAPQAKFCIFYPLCKNPTCRFLHPKKVCKFGLNCTNWNCEFDHSRSTIPSVDKLKWNSKA